MGSKGKKSKQKQNSSPAAASPATTPKSSASSSSASSSAAADAAENVTPPAPTDSAAPNAVRTEPASPVVPPPEDQGARWLKYGANVVVTSLAVVMLAVIATWAAQGTNSKTAKLHVRADLTADAANQLKPQTLNLLQGLPADAEVKIVSLQPRLRKDESQAQGADTYQRLMDILDEYRRAGKNVTVQAIDPIAEPGEADAWLTQLVASVRKKYKPTVEGYEAFLKTLPDTLKQLAADAKAESAGLEQIRRQVRLAAQQTNDQSLAAVWFELGAIGNTINVIEQRTDAFSPTIRAGLGERIVDYSGLTDSAETLLSGIAEFTSQTAALMEGYTKASELPPPLREYAGQALPRFRKLEQQARAAAAAAAKAGGPAEPKDDLILGPSTQPAATQPTTQPTDYRPDLRRELDELRTKLTPKGENKTLPTSVVVSGQHGIRVIDQEALWGKAAAGGILSMNSGSEPPRLRFAGEQQITSAILGVSQPVRKRIVIVRAAGVPETAGDRDAWLGELVTRLRGYNYEVLERDISRRPGDPPTGMGPPPMNEATDEQMRDAVWIVVGLRGQPMGRQMLPSLSERLTTHLQQGGSALVLLPLAQREDLAEPLRTFGLESPGGVIAVHEPIDVGGDVTPTDRLEEARRVPFLFVAKEFGEHPITKPLRALDAVLLNMGFVRRSRVNGTDLIMKDESASVAVRSPSRKFETGDVGVVLRVKDPAGTNWKAGRYRITAVDADGNATLESSPALGEQAQPIGPTGWELERDAALPEGVSVTPILPLPETPRSWGESNLQSAMFGPRGTMPRPEFDPNADLAGPLHMGAVAERGKSRLVVIAGFEFALSQIVREPDPDLGKARITASRFPANGELVTNSVFWLSRDEGLMALSPSAMDVPRIAAIPAQQLAFLRYGTVLALLPLIPIVLGVWVWTTRRG